MRALRLRLTVLSGVNRVIRFLTVRLFFRDPLLLSVISSTVCSLSLFIHPSKLEARESVLLNSKVYDCLGRGAVGPLVVPVKPPNEALVGFSTSKPAFAAACGVESN